MVAAHVVEAATARVDRTPSAAQKEAGNYRKGHLTLHGMPVTIETPAGATRSGVGPDGKPWAVTLPYNYGYVKRTLGADGDQVDVCLGSDLASHKVFIVDQQNAETGRFDEHKVFLGYHHHGDVENAYDAGFSDGNGPKRRRAITATDVEGFKDWLRHADTTQPAAEHFSGAIEKDGALYNTVGTAPQAMPKKAPDRLRWLRRAMRWHFADMQKRWAADAAANDLVVLGKAQATALLAKAAKRKTNDEIATSYEQPLASSLASVFRWAQNVGGNAMATVAQTSRDVADIVSAFPTTTFENKLSTALNPLEGAFTDGAGNGVARAPKQIRVNFDLRSPAVTAYLANYKMDLIRQISDDQQAAIHGIVTRAVSAGLPPAEMARNIRLQAGLGLTTNQAQSVESYSQSLQDLDAPGALGDVLGRKLRDQRFDGTIQNAYDSGSPLSADQINTMVDAYRRRYVAYRSMTIARTESMKATNLGSKASAQSVADGGNYDVTKTWHATHDKKTRPTHRALDGQSVDGMETPFVTINGDQIQYPHDPDAPADEIINCRCHATYTFTPKPGAESDIDVNDLPDVEEPDVGDLPDLSDTGADDALDEE